VRTFIPFLTAALLLAGCGAPAPRQDAANADAAPAATKAPMPAPEDRRFPVEGRGEVTQTADPLYGKKFLTGGNIAKYKRGASEFELFLIKSSNPSAPASMMFEYKGALTGAKFIAHFGGYAGKDGDTEVFLFSKGNWLAGIRGLPLAEADLLARDFASRLD
jgi:hypothetical protein